MRLLTRASQTTQGSLIAPEDFAQFYEQAHLGVFRYLMVLCDGNQSEAEEITAEAFFRAWEKRRQFSGSMAAALGWVIAIARNLLIDHRRREGTHPEGAMPDESMSDDGSPIEEVLIDEEQLQGVLDALHSLPFLQKELLTLRYVLGWRTKAIAEHLGWAENTVSVNLRRALTKLQNNLVSQESGEGRSV